MIVDPLPPRMGRLQEDGWLSAEFPQIAARRERAQQAGQRLAGDQPLWDWAQGHKWFGLHQEPDGSWVYRDWLPNAKEVCLLGDFNGWQQDAAYAAKRVLEDQWELRLPAGTLAHGQLYRMALSWPGGAGQRLPAWGTRMVQDATNMTYAAQIWSPTEPYVWKNTTPPPSRFPRIYEAHVGMGTEEAKVGSWTEFRLQQLPRIAAAGYDTLQLMAVKEHPYYGSFGYHVGSFFAASSRFGTPEELKALVDDAHCLGLRVVMDLVHSHAVKNVVEGIACYDGTDHQFFHSGARGEHQAWDSRCFDYAKPQVVHFLLSNLRYWLEEYRFDGFRFDGVTSMLYRDHGLGATFGSYADYFNSNVDEAAVTYLTLANELLHQAPNQAISIAEDVSGMPGLAADTADGGVGFDYRLAMGLVDCWFRLVKEVRDEDWAMETLWHELRDHRRDERAISYVESHDQAMVGGKSFIFEMIDAEMYHAMHRGSQSLLVERGIALHKMARLVTLATAGHGYMNFMGNEFGHPEWVDFPREGNGWSYAKARRQWSLRDAPDLRFKGLADFDTALMTLPEPQWAVQPAELVKADNGDHVLAFRRGSYLVVCNFHPEKSYADYGFCVAEGAYHKVCSTDDVVFGGFGREQRPVTRTDGPWLRTYLPSRTATVWKHHE